MAARSRHEEGSLLASKNLGSAETSPLPVQGVSMAIRAEGYLPRARARAKEGKNVFPARIFLHHLLFFGPGRVSLKCGVRSTSSTGKTTDGPLVRSSQ